VIGFRCCPVDGECEDLTIAQFHGPSSPVGCVEPESETHPNLTPLASRSSKLQAPNSKAEVILVDDCWLKTKSTPYSLKITETVSFISAALKRSAQDTRLRPGNLLAAHPSHQVWLGEST